MSIASSGWGVAAHLEGSNNVKFHAYRTFDEEKRYDYDNRYPLSEHFIRQELHLHLVYDWVDESLCFDPGAR